MRFPNRSKTWLGLILAVLVLLVAASADAGKKQKKKDKNKKPRAQQSQAQTPVPEPAEPLPAALDRPAAFAGIDDELWAWDTASARQELEATSATGPDFEAAWGRVLSQEAQHAEAANRLRAAASAAPEDPAPLVYLGQALLAGGDAGGADDAFRRAADRAQALARSYPNNAKANYWHGVALLWAFRFDEALAALEKARTQAPGDPLVAYHLGVVHSARERWSDAVARLDEAIAGDDGLAYAYYYRGLAQDRLGRKDLMVADLERFLVLAPHSPDAVKARRILGGV